MPNKSILGILLVPSFILLVPLVAMQFTTEVNWTLSDFVFAWVIMAGTGLAYWLATRNAANLAYRFAAGLALAAAFMIVWGNLAVGFIGGEGNPANLMYAGVLALGFAGALIARFQPQGMARALYTTALAQFLVPVIALPFWRSEVTLLVIGLNSFFVLMFAGSAWLFQRAACQSNRPGVETMA
jgi:hypothetical protein